MVSYVRGCAAAVRGLFLVPLAPREFVTLALGAPSLDGYALVAGSYTAGKAAWAANFADASGKLLTVVLERDTGLVREVFYRYAGRTLHVVFESRRDTARQAVTANPQPSSGVGVLLTTGNGTLGCDDPERLSTLLALSFT